jgi:hypothetical protein
VGLFSLAACSMGNGDKDQIWMELKMGVNEGGMQEENIWTWSGGYAAGCKEDKDDS